MDKIKLPANKDAKAQWEEAKAMGNPETHKKALEEERKQKIKEAHKRLLDAQNRAEQAKKK